MAILQAHQGERELVIWVDDGARRPDDAPFRERDLSLRSLPATEVIGMLPFARGLYLVHDVAKQGRTHERLDQLGAAALDQNVRVVVLTEPRHEPAVRDACKRTGLVVDPEDLPCVEIVHGVAGWVAPDAQRMERHRPGHAPAVARATELKADGLGDEDALLLARAFADAETLRLRELSGGRSAAVYDVGAQLRAASPDDVVRRPLPYFAKLDDRRKIRREFRNYHDLVDTYVPFRNRPHLDQLRCFLGSRRGVLVGDFVDHAEPFRDAIARGGAHHLITSLFDDALGGWRLHAGSSEPSSAYSAFARVLAGELTEARLAVANMRGATCSTRECTVPLASRHSRVWQSGVTTRTSVRMLRAQAVVEETRPSARRASALCKGPQAVAVGFSRRARGPSRQAEVVAIMLPSRRARRASRRGTRRVSASSAPDAA